MYCSACKRIEIFKYSCSEKRVMLKKIILLCVVCIFVISGCTIDKTGKAYAGFADDIPPGLSMHFTMDAVEKNAYDLFKGGVSVKGVRGEAVCFDGSNDYIYLGRNSNLRENSQVTYMFWTKTSENEGGYVLGAGAKGGHGYGGVFLGQHEVSYVWTPSDPGRDTWAKSVDPYPFLTGVWTHVALTVDYAAEDIKIYVNGEDMGVRYVYNYDQTRNVVDATPVSKYNHNIPDSIGGRLINDKLNYFKGCLDDVFVVDRVLTLEEIKGYAFDLPGMGSLDNSCFAYY